MKSFISYILNKFKSIFFTKEWKHELNGREVYITAVDGDCEEDGYISEAYFLDGDGEELSNDELDQLTNLYPEVISEMLLDRQIARADALCDELKGH